MKLDPDTAFLRDSDAQKICECFTSAGYAIYFVGGCVRNALLGTHPSDIDLATDAHPSDALALAERHGIKAIPTGFDHGTVTLILSDTPFEVTTFRRDVKTDGRRAVVSFSDRIEDDARRRDFTMNALYARADGEVVDPLGGLTDLFARKVVFIDDARARIREDYLRILRFFRFWSFYADRDHGFDAEVLAAISDTTEGLASLSEERIGSEMLKLLSAPDPGQAMATMQAIGVLRRVLPISDTTALFHLIELEADTHTSPSALRRLAVIGADNPRDRLRLSRRQGRDLEALIAHAGSGYSFKALGFLLGTDLGWDAALIRAASTGASLNGQDRECVESGASMECPVTAKDLMPQHSGSELGRELERLRSLWLASDLTLTRNELLG